MDLNSLVNASLELEKRIATDKLLRKYFSNVWKNSHQKPAASNSQKPHGGSRPNPPQITLTFPPEMCELLELASNSTGKTPSELLEESFVEYYLKKIAPSQKASVGK